MRATGPDQSNERGTQSTVLEGASLTVSLLVGRPQMNSLIAGVRDNNLKLSLSFGIGLHHAGLHERDRATVEELFVNQKIQVGGVRRERVRGASGAACR